MEMQPIEHMRIDGFIPIIINVAPVSLPMLLGLSPKTSDPGDDAGTASRAYPQAAAKFFCFFLDFCFSRSYNTKNANL